MSVSLYDIYLQCFISDVTLHHAVGARALNKLWHKRRHVLKTEHTEVKVKLNFWLCETASC